MLALRIDEALDMVEQIERQLGDVPPADASRFRAAAQLLRAAGFALQDDSLGAVAIAGSYLEMCGGKQDHHAAATLFRLGFWQLGKFELFHSIPRHRARQRGSKSEAISSMLDLSIEAAMALDRLNLSIARRLTLDALDVAETALNGLGGLAALPASLEAQMLYEQSCLEQAEDATAARTAAFDQRGGAHRSRLARVPHPCAYRHAQNAIRLRSLAASRSRGLGGTPRLAPG